MWKVVRASVAGTSHRDSRLPCQDHSVAKVIGRKHLMCVVADGAGGAALGGKGAETACAMVESRAKNLFGRGKRPVFGRALAEQWTGDIREALRMEALKWNRSASDYACTLSVALVSPGEALFFQIGDGAIVVSTKDVLGVVFWPEEVPYANMTHFLTDEDALCHLDVHVTKTSVFEIALLTDGLFRLALSCAQQVPHIPFFEPLFREIGRQTPRKCRALSRQLGSFLDSTGVNGRTDDDKTLVLATRRTP